MVRKEERELRARERERERREEESTVARRQMRPAPRVEHHDVIYYYWIRCSVHWQYKQENMTKMRPL